MDGVDPSRAGVAEMARGADDDDSKVLEVAAVPNARLDGKEVVQFGYVVKA